MRKANRRLRISIGLSAGLVVAAIGAPVSAARALLSAADASPAAPEVGWPDSPAGHLGRGWLEAFNAGEPAMRRFLAEQLTEASLAERGVDARLVTYRELRQRLGRLALAEVSVDEPKAVTVTFVDGERLHHEFTFVATEEAPHRLAKIEGRVTQRHHGASH
jgi:hypothetical protein